MFLSGPTALWSLLFGLSPRQCSLFKIVWFGARWLYSWAQLILVYVSSDNYCLVSPKVAKFSDQTDVGSNPPSFCPLNRDINLLILSLSGSKMKPILFISQGCDVDSPGFLDADCLVFINCFRTSSGTPLSLCAACVQPFIWAWRGGGCPSSCRMHSLLVFLTLRRPLSFHGTLQARETVHPVAGHGGMTPLSWPWPPAVMCWERPWGSPGCGEQQPLVDGKGCRLHRKGKQWRPCCVFLIIFSLVKLWSRSVCIRNVMAPTDALSFTCGATFPKFMAIHMLASWQKTGRRNSFVSVRIWVLTNCLLLHSDWGARYGALGQAAGLCRWSRSLCQLLLTKRPTQEGLGKESSPPSHPASPVQS